MTGKVNTQLLIDATWVKEEPVNGSGPAKEAQHQLDSLRPQDLSIMFGKPQGADLGLSNRRSNFMLGLASPMKLKTQTMRKPKGSDQKRNNENKGPIGKERVMGGTRKHAQVDDKSSETNMEIDLSEMGTKRKAQSPLSKLDNKEGNGKQIRVEGEVKELGKLLAQHLGSAEAGNQPHQTQ